MPSSPHPVTSGPARRRFLALAGTSVLGAMVAACSSSDGTASGDAAPSTSTTTDPTATTVAPTAGGGASGAAASSATTLTAADFASLGSCALLPEKTAGPFPLDEQFDRRDVTEGYEGHPVRLGLRVLDASCAAVPGAKVEIWHADATGDYSAFTDGGGGKDEGSGTTFLRGTQTANDEGIVEFLTVYPGWYRGRAVHIHLRVHLDDATVLTSQMFFDEDDTAQVYRDAPYAQYGLPDTSNSRDRIAGDPTSEGTLLATTAGETSRGAGTLALLNLGIDRAAGSVA
jgi:protocatechuate 3,4-dioxygenase beta subunit